MTQNSTETYHTIKLQHQAGPNSNEDPEEGITDYGPTSDGFRLRAVEDTASHASSEQQSHTPIPIINSHPNIPSIYLGGTTFMDQFFNNQYTTLQWQNLDYPFASAEDWRLALWLLCSWLSMAAISNFLSLQLRVWSLSAWIVHIYKEWMLGNHAWNLQDQIPTGPTLLGVILSSDKTNISVMTRNRMVHPLLLSLTNINADIRNSHSQLTIQLARPHESLDFVLKPLKVAVAVGVMMSDPISNLHYCFTPLVTYIADTPEQSLLACISPKASPVWIEADPNDFEEFLKVTKCYSLSGVHKPFWWNWPLSNPSKFLMPEVLHHFHHLFWDHDLQWCIVVLGPAKIDYHFSLVQRPVGYHSFGEGVSKFKQVTGCDHRAMQRYIVGVIAGAVPPKFLLSINALLSFFYLAQMPRFDHDTLARVKTALQTFHDTKTAIISSSRRQGSNGPLQHWEIPKLELLQHVVVLVHNSGAIMQWTADVTEHAHVTEIKQPTHTGNNQDYYAQIAWHLDCSEKCFQFDLATHLASAEQGELSKDDKDKEDKHEPDLEALHISHYTPSCMSVNYFESAEALASGTIPNAILPHRIFTSSTTAFCLAFKPSLHITIDEAVETFGEVPNPAAEKVQIWFKVRVQQPSYHDRLSLESPQSLVVFPPSTYLPGVKQASNWPLNGLRGKFFRAEDVNQDLLVELQGTTIDEQLLKAQSHYILDQCKKMLPVIMNHIPQADVKLLLTISSLQNGDEFLYHDGHWELTELPQILRLSQSSSAGSPQPRQSRSSAALRHENVNRCIPGTSWEEAVEGTFLPTAGSEEWQVAKWLNKIILAVWALVPGSAESSCKPIKDDLMPWKPDMVLQEDSLGCAFRPQPELSWKDIILFMEIMSRTYSLSDDIGTTCNAVMCKAYAVFVSQPGRWFLFALSITAMLALSDPEHIGYNLTLIYFPSIPQQISSWGASPGTIQVTSITYNIIDLIFSFLICGWATSCWHVCLNNEHYMVKDSWTCASWVSHEEDILHEIQNLKGVLQLVAAWTVEIGGLDDEMHLCHELIHPSDDVQIHCRLVMQPVATPLSNFKSIRELLSVFINVLDSTSKQKSTVQVLTMPAAHMSLVMEYFILRHDISDNNLMIYPCNISKGKSKQCCKVEASSNEECLRDDKGFQDDNRDSHIESHHNDAVDSGKEETHEQKLHRWDQERHQLIEASILHNGLLIDFNYVTKLDQSQPWALTAGDCTGTVPFMLANILISYKKDEMMHSASDDLELLVYVLVWICVLYTGPGTVHQDKHITQTVLKPWVSVTSPTDAVNLGLHKRGLTTEPSMVTDEFTTFFKPLCSTVDKLLRAVGSSWSTTNDAHNYKTIRDILLEGFGTVKKVPNWSGHKDTHGYGLLKGKVNLFVLPRVD
ncbi:hypothetical protein EDC04DRAFT_2601510 [Pisolithus marmoratus]|nr:hypothetical protein EDC04DRAFT_2601510 [Pisolithus marmoratus]